ncbi:MATE efflux family protein [Astrocystis sublimbata]|nr:MATE efflux family protein [Astrocystis sublimbata]
MSSPKSVPERGTAGPHIASSFPGSNQSARDIVDRDLAECSENEVVDGVDSDDDESQDGTGLGPVLYKQPSGVAFNSRHPTVVDNVPVIEPGLTRDERQKSRDAERSLLRDNHLLPPKRGTPGILARLRRTIFRTKERRTPHDEEVPTVSFGQSETSPLLPPLEPATPSAEQLDAQWEAAVAQGIIETTWQREAKTIARNSPPLILTFMLQYSINITSVFTVGRIGKLELGAVTLSTMTANIFCYAFFQGLATSLDTLCAQAYGSGHRHLVGLQLQRMTYFLLLLGIPISVFFVFAGDILRYLVPEPEAADLAGLYLRIAIGGIPGYAAFEGGKRFLQSQGLFSATTYVLLISAPINVLVNWLLVWHFGLGFKGAPIAVVFTQTLMPILLALYVVFIDGHQCWGGFSKRALTNWGPMIRLAIPGMIMVVAELLAFEILTLLSARFGTAYLAAQSVLVTVAATMYMIPFPFSIASSTRIANLIGAKLVGAAKTSAKVAVGIGFILGVFNLTLLWSLRFQIPQLFTNDQEVIEIVASVLPLCAVMQVFDVLAAIAHGILRGIGKQSFGGYANLIVYYLIAEPISIVAAFVFGWKLFGLWLGTTIGLALIGAVEYWYCSTRDWEQSVREAEHRNASG